MTVSQGREEATAKRAVSHCYEFKRREGMSQSKDCIRVKV